MLPAEGLMHKRYSIRAATTKEQRTHWNTLWLLPVGIDHRTLLGRSRVARVGVRSLTTAVGRPSLAGPVDQLGRCLLGHALPPHVAIGRQGHVGEDRVAVDGIHGRAVRVVRGARCHTKEATLGVDGSQLAVVGNMQPSNVVADAANRPAGQRRNQHGKVGLAACRWERSAHVVLFALRRRQAEDQHVLSEPALLATEARSDTKRIALLAEQGIATVARTVRPYGWLVRKVADVDVVRVARPAYILISRLQGMTNRVYTWLRTHTRENE